MALFVLSFSNEDFAARKAMFFGNAIEAHQVWVWADNAVQVALVFPEATIKQDDFYSQFRSPEQMGKHTRSYINYIID